MNPPPPPRLPRIAFSLNQLLKLLSFNCPSAAIAIDITTIIMPENAPIAIVAFCEMCDLKIGHKPNP